MSGAQSTMTPLRAAITRSTPGGGLPKPTFDPRARPRRCLPIPSCRRSLFRAPELVAGHNAADRFVELTGLIQLHHVVVAIEIVTVQLADEDPAARVEGHRNGVSEHRLAATSATRKPGGSEPLQTLEGSGAAWRRRLV